MANILNTPSVFFANLSHEDAAKNTLSSPTFLYHLLGLVVTMPVIPVDYIVSKDPHFDKLKEHKHQML
jgi:hypothetical protein